MLLDHFHAPLDTERHWTGFHSAWATNLAVDLNQQLPDGWFAEPQVRWSVEVDVATFEEANQLVWATIDGHGEELADLPTPYKTIDFDLRTDEVEVRLFKEDCGTPLVGMVELVSPANKEGPEARDAFTSKCDTYLRDAVGLAIVDMVTKRRANMHSLLVERFGETDGPVDPIYASAYRPIRTDDAAELAMWYQPLAIGAPLPSLPLFLKNGPVVRLNLDHTYSQTCRDLKIKQG